MDVSPPAAWTIPPSPRLAASSQARSPEAARNKIRRDVQRSVSSILAQYNYPPTQLTCTTTAASLIQGELTTEDCTKDGQLRSIGGTVYYTCSQMASQALRRAKREVLEDTSRTSAVSSTTSTTPERPSVACVFIMDWEYQGHNETAVMEYYKQRNFIDQVAHGLFNSSELKFAATVGEFGYVQGGEAIDDVRAISDNYTDFQQTLFGKQIFNGDLNVSYCDALDDLKDYPLEDRAPEGAKKCLIIFYGGEYNCNDTSRRWKRQANTLEKYEHTIGVTLNGEAVSPLKPSFSVDLNTDTQNSSQNLVNFVLKTVLDEADGSTTFSNSEAGESITSSGETPSPTAEGSTGATNSEISQGTSPSSEGMTTENTVTTAITEEGSTASQLTGTSPAVTSASPRTTTVSVDSTPTNAIVTDSSPTSKSTHPTTAITPRPTFTQNPISMAVTVQCRSITPATWQIWSKFLEKLQRSLEKAKVAFNKDLAL